MASRSTFTPLLGRVRRRTITQEGTMSDETNTAGEGDRIDIDLTQIDSPFSIIEKEGTYPIVLESVELSRSQTDRPMLRCRWVAKHPETGEQIGIFDYPLLDTQGGKFRLRQMVLARGLDERNWTVPQLVGAAASAELKVEDSDEYGKSNKIVRLLVEVPKARRG